jgi:P27 family predicted phage terminase small subunit
LVEKRLPPAPSGLKGRGHGLWRRIVADYDLSPADLEVLGEACKVANVCDDLDQVLARDGLTVLGSKGQPRTHPALTELRGQRGQLSMLLAQLRLPGEVLEAPASVRARKAATSRWDRRRHLKAVPPAKTSRYAHLQQQPRPPA